MQPTLITHISFLIVIISLSLLSHSPNLHSRKSQLKDDKYLKNKLSVSEGSFYNASTGRSVSKILRG